MDSSAVTLKLHDDKNRIAQVVALELPLYIKQLSRVQELFGGVENLQEKHQSKSRFLPIKLRPTEPSCKPLHADLTTTQSIVLRVRRKKKGSDQSNVKVEVVGVMHDKYTCEGMADFQYFTSKRFVPAPSIAILNDEAKERHKLLMLRLEERKRQLSPYLNVKEKGDLELLPEVFSKVDIPLKYQFKQRSGYKNADIGKRKYSGAVIFFDFHDKIHIPMPPDPNEKFDIRLRTVGEIEPEIVQDVLEVIQQRLVKKPIWLRSTMLEGFDPLQCRVARHVLCRLCYVFLDGPWRWSWIKKGYDPRRTQEGARYQVVEIRSLQQLLQGKVDRLGNGRMRNRSKYTKDIDKKGLKKKENTLQSVRKSRLILKKVIKNSDQSAQASVRPRRKDKHSVIQLEQLLVSSDGKTENSDPKEAQTQDSHTRDKEDVAGIQTHRIFGIPLRGGSMGFQVDEIDDPDIKAWIERFQVLQEKPNITHGWYSHHLFPALREMIRFHVACMVQRSPRELALMKSNIESLQVSALEEYGKERLRSEGGVNNTESTQQPLGGIESMDEMDVDKVEEEEQEEEGEEGDAPNLLDSDDNYDMESNNGDINDYNVDGMSNGEGVEYSF
uniref:Uncharacterized protein AlNc14C974G12680 n=1 Tax=Albugo laibachii Nc14 TaxID=890382 RepID=F0X2C9_9STRA|nr:conserved hypothetical protein [Albugo laibachii Nc14]|eukprot:CCA28015.1 conserved hypothetical protein [Albugo laibachii Nc14]